jgi:hypothetical protein
MLHKNSLYFNEVKQFDDICHFGDYDFFKVILDCCEFELTCFQVSKVSLLFCYSCRTWLVCEVVRLVHCIGLLAIRDNVARPISPAWHAYPVGYRSNRGESKVSLVLWQIRSGAYSSRYRIVAWSQSLRGKIVINTAVHWDLGYVDLVAMRLPHCNDF